MCMQYCSNQRPPAVTQPNLSASYVRSLNANRCQRGAGLINATPVTHRRSMYARGMRRISESQSAIPPTDSRSIPRSHHVLFPYFPEDRHRLRNDLKCVEWDVKPCSIQFSQEDRHQHYFLKQCPHSKALIPKTTYLGNRDYIIEYCTRTVISLTALPIIPCCNTAITRCV